MKKEEQIEFDLGEDRRGSSCCHSQDGQCQCGGACHKQAEYQHGIGTKVDFHGNVIETGTLPGWDSIDVI